MYLQSAEVGLQWNHQATIPEHTESPSTTPNSSWIHKEQVPGFMVIKSVGYQWEAMNETSIGVGLWSCWGTSSPAWTPQPAAQGPEKQVKVWTSFEYPL